MMRAAEEKFSDIASAELREFARSLPMSLLRARERVMDEFRPHLRALGVTEQQWRVLRALSGGLQWRLNELAEHTQISMPSLSRIVPVLVAKGWLVRRADDIDGRSSRVALTSNGQAFFDSGAEKSETIYREIEDRFGRARMDALYQLLDELNACLARP